MAEFLGLFFIGELDRLLGLFAEGELLDFFMDLGDEVLELFLELEWDAHTLEWASRSWTLVENHNIYQLSCAHVRMVK